MTCLLKPDHGRIWIELGEQRWFKNKVSLKGPLELVFLQLISFPTTLQNWVSHVCHGAREMMGFQNRKHTRHTQIYRLRQMYLCISLADRRVPFSIPRVSVMGVRHGFSPSLLPQILDETCPGLTTLCHVSTPHISHAVTWSHATSTCWFYTPACTRDDQ